MSDFWAIPSTSSRSEQSQQKEGERFFAPSEKRNPFFRGKTIQAKLTIGQPNDPYEQEADALADKIVQRQSVQQNDGTPFFKTGRNVPVQLKCAACEEEERSGENKETVQLKEEEMPDELQRKPGDEEELQAKELAVQRHTEDGPEIAAEDSTGAEAPATEPGIAATGTSGKFIVEDTAEATPDQMRKTDFLTQLKTQIAEGVNELLGHLSFASGINAYINSSFARYWNYTPAQLEKLIQREVPPAMQAQNALQLLQLVKARAMAEVNKQFQSFTGLSGVAELAGNVAGQIGSAVSGIASGIADAVPGAVDFFFKAAPAGAQAMQSPGAVMQRLGKGNSLDGGTQSKMESAFGTSFSGVKIHTDPHAANLSKGMNARAFTIGQHIAFADNEYKPGTIEGDALMAHELAHTVQQSGGALQQKNGHLQDAGSSAEKEADSVAINVVSETWGGKKGMNKKNILPRIKSGLSIARCKSEEEKKREKLKAEFIKKRTNETPPVPPMPAVAGTAASLGTQDKVMDSYQRYQDKEPLLGGLVWGFYFSKNSELQPAVKKPSKLENWKQFSELTALQKQTLLILTHLLGADEIQHNRYSQTKGNLEKLQRVLSEFWPDGYYAIYQSGSAEETNTCNVFLGETLYQSGRGRMNKDKYWSAAQVYAGAKGSFVEIDKAFTSPGDIAAWGGHVGVVVEVDPEKEIFNTREGYIKPKGSIRKRNFDELLGIGSTLKVFRTGQ